VRRGYAAEAIEATIARLIDLKLIDDAAFARFLLDQRATFRASGRRRLAAELRAKGIGRDLIDETLQGQDDAASIEEVARKRAAALADVDAVVFTRRLHGFLLRRGYGASLAREVVQRLRRER
jgi:regulatory protein